MQIATIKLTEKETRCIKMELDNCATQKTPPYPFASKSYDFFVTNVKNPYEKALKTAKVSENKDVEIGIPANLTICMQKLSEAALDNWEANLDENFVNEDEIEDGDIDTSDFEGKDDSNL